MAPGQRKGKRMPAEAPPCEYENVRAQNILRNSLALQRLGVSAAASLLNSSMAKTTKRKASAREDSDSLYEPDEESEDIEQGVVDKLHEATQVSSTMNGNSRSAVTRLSKRVMAPNEHDHQQPTRNTRQRTRELSVTENGTPPNPQESSLHDEFVAATSEENEGELDAMIERPNRGRNMGKGLDKMTHGFCSKMPLRIVEGKRRPEVPMQAAKLASEAGIVLRQHMPIFTHWKKYKNDESQLVNFMGKVAGQFVMDTKNDAVIAVCSDLLKCGQRQMRHMLKKKYFDGVPANQVPTTSPVPNLTDEQWRALVAMWSDPKHKEKCVKNRANREKVQLQQKTGSRSFIAHCHAVREEKYKDVPPTEIDLFKDCHCSSKTGFTEPVKEVVANMEARMVESAQEGQAQKTPAEIISEVLPKTTFLQNAGLKTKGRGSKAAAARVEELEGQLEDERQVAQDLREKMELLEKQMAESEAARLKQAEESEAARLKQLEEVENLKKASEHTQSLLRGLLELNKGSTLTNP